MAKKKVFAVEVKPCYLCNQDCIMCPFHEKNSTHTMSWEEVLSNLEFIKENVEFGRFELSGGEPTIYKHFFDILDWLKEYYPKTAIYIHTNGIKLADESFVRKLSQYNVVCYVSFHNPDEEASRIITRRKNHYKLLMAGLENLTKYNIPIETSVVLTKLNQDRLDEINQELSKYPLRRVTYRLPHLIKREGVELYKPDIIGLVDKVKAAQKSLNIPGRMDIGSFPSCFFGTEKLSNKDFAFIIVFFDKQHQKDNAGVGFNYESAIGNTKYYGEYVKEKQCEQCTFDRDCRGISSEYLRDMHRNKMNLTPVKI
jgi:uncharacterized Fe-S cluster-containing radical SAM superfamily protein